MQDFKVKVEELLKQMGVTQWRYLHHKTSDSFGDAVVTYNCGPVDVRFVRDRGQECVEVSGAGKNDFYYLERVLKDAGVKTSPKTSQSLEESLSEFLKNFSPISKHFAVP